MARNSVRTSSEMATIAAHTLSGNFDEAFIEMLARQIMENVEAHRYAQEAMIEEIAQSLAASVLSNRRA